MKRTRGRGVRIDSLEDLDRRLDRGARRLSGWRLHGLDLTGHGQALLGCRLSGATFLGCTFAPGDAGRVEAAGALVLPAIGDVPVDVYRAGLYDADELYDAAEYAASTDARAYAWSQEDAGADSTLARALHDHAVDRALLEWTDGRSLVGVMGGHALVRGEATYADAARLGAGLGGRHVVATGGGPGAMEAANLGARLAHRSPDDLVRALEILARVPSYHPSVDAWVATAREVRDAFGEPTDSLSIPTWHYGHEPANLFATAIAKYFRNSTREAILLEICDAGIVFLPGAAGTVQEVFQDACENYYADETSVAPMVLVGVRHWTQTVPAWPLLSRLAHGRAMDGHVHLVDTVDEAIALVQR
ncbi:LOG family protein [Nocardioides sp. cx-173]|uniref:LOG family protein n=1 Tax=Nocardioides sp. cx-173 TaxID=2898796 RepID=UPI001E46EB83|nr:Rossmann fold nucleotide-binding protein [Nocardioides sp. cx-173]MCD4524827.1 Rossmann fold nucleotide-binding protein [Nocardioides sp. cx-173]UGB43333.1 Rossmann fold nucleotide-binding protein [Nocardioides sp. cx-173]